MDAWFVNPNLLWFVSLAGLPWIVRFFFRPRYPVVLWPTNRLMAAAHKKLQARTSWLQWILITVQSMTLGMLGVSLAGPTGGPASLIGSPEDSSRICWILVVDDSMSMEYREDALSHFQFAMQEAQDVVNGASNRDALALVSMTSLDPGVISVPTFNHARVRQRLADWKTRPHRADLSRTLNFLEQQVLAIRRSGVRFDKIHVRFWTDLSTVTWPTPMGSDFERRYAGLQQDAVVHVTDLGNYNKGNLTVDRLSGFPYFVPEGRSIAMTARVTNQDPLDKVVTPLRVYVDGVFYAEQRVELQPLETRDVRVNFEVQGEGNHWIHAEVSDTHLPSDNQRWAIVEAPGELDVICWSDQLREREYLMQGFKALSRDGTTIKVRSGDVEDVLPARIKYTLLVLGSVSEVTARDANRLREFLQRGGGVAVFAGPNAKPWQTLGIFDEMWQDASAWKSQASRPLELVWPQSKSGLLSGFQDRGRETILRTPVWNKWTLPQAKQMEWETGLDTRESGVLLGTLRLDRGQCWFWLSSVDPEAGENELGEPWSAFAIWPSYVPVLSHMLFGTLGDRTATRETVPIDPQTEMKNDSGWERWERIAPRDDSDVEGADARLGPGVYREALGLGQSRLHAFNFDPSELQGQRTTMASLPQWFQTKPEVELDAKGPSPSVPHMRWYQALLLGVLLLLVLELGLYRRMLGPRPVKVQGRRDGR